MTDPSVSPVPDQPEEELVVTFECHLDAEYVDSASPANAARLLGDLLNYYGIGYRQIGEVEVRRA